MTKLVITPDDYYTRQEHYTFIVYDFETGKLEYIKDKCNELDCKHLEGQLQFSSHLHIYFLLDSFQMLHI
jgi:hypothetical protein